MARAFARGWAGKLARGGSGDHRPARMTAAVIEQLESRCLLSSGTASALLSSIPLDLQQTQPLAAKAAPTRKLTSLTKPARLRALMADGRIPFRKTPLAIPGAIQFEQFDRGGEGIAYHDATPGNQIGSYRDEDVDLGPAKDLGRGYYVGQTSQRERLEYTVNVLQTGFYDVAFRLASLGPGGKFHIEIDHVKQGGMLTVPNTGGWQAWTTMTRPLLYMSQGYHVVSIVMDARGPRGYVGNFNWMKFMMPIPDAPSNLTAVTSSALGITLNWQDNSYNENAFKIERKAGIFGTWQQIATWPANFTSYTDTGLEPGTDYYYQVRATNATGDSTYTLPASAITGSAGNIVITQGGVYSGDWQSLDPNVPAVSIQTSEPVIIENSTIRSRGTLIEASGVEANLTVRNTAGYGLNPNLAGRYPGRFLEAEGFVNVDLENNYLEGTSGIYLYNYYGSVALGQTVKILRNSAKNIDGRFSNGAGGFMTGPDDFYMVQFVQFNAVHNIAGAEIAWNQVVNEPGKSRVEDNISIFDSSGTSASPILIHDNYIQGAYPVSPAAEADYSGGGIMLSDGGSSWVRAFQNQVVATSNYGIAISSGHDNYFYSNRILSSGYLPDGRDNPNQNVGAYIWNHYESPVFYNNSGRDNLVGWMRWGERNDWWMPSATSWTANSNWPGALSTTTEVNEFLYWQSKLNGAGVAIGKLT